MSPDVVSRRTLLRGAAGSVVAPVFSGAVVPAVGVAATACAPLRDLVQVVVVWSGTELEVFRKALVDFEHVDDVELISAGDGIGALLRSRIEAGHPPDIAVLPNPGLVAELQHEGKLVPIEGEIAPDDDPMSQRSLLEHGDSLFGVWVKVTHKSVFWCREEFPASRVLTLGNLVNELTRLAGQGRRPLSIGAADGWVLTDWFENALLAVDPKSYGDLAAKTEDSDRAVSLWGSSSVRDALMWLGRIWGVPGVFADGPERALVTQYDEATLRTFVNHRDDAVVTLGGDYTTLLLRPYQRENLAPNRIDSFRFPGGVADSQPLLVGGDAAVLLRRPDGRPPHDKARQLIRWLAGEDASRALVAGGFLTLYETLVRRKARPAEMSATQWQLTRQLDGGSPKFDLSDLLQGGLARSDGQGLAGILQTFFEKVAERGDGSFDGGRVVRDEVKRAHAAIIGAAGKS